MGYRTHFLHALLKAIVEELVDEVPIDLPWATSATSEGITRTAIRKTGATTGISTYTNSGDGDNGWLARPAVHLLDCSESVFAPQAWVANREP